MKVETVKKYVKNGKGWTDNKRTSAKISLLSSMGQEYLYTYI